MDSRARQARAAGAEGMAERDGTAMRVHPGVVVAHAQLPQHRQALGGEGLVQLDDVHVAQVQAGAGQQLLHGGHGSDAHDPRLDPCGRHGDDAGARRQAVAPGRVLAGDQQGGSAVVHARCVAGSDGAGVAERGLQLRQRLHGGFAGMLVTVYHGVALAALDGDGGYFLGKKRLGCGCFLLAPQGEGVLVGSGDLVLLRHVLRRFRHGVGAMHRPHQGVHEAPADGGVIDVRLAGEGFGGLGHYEGGAGHALDAAGEHQVGFAGAYGSGGGAYGIQAAAAQAVDGGAGHARGQAGQQQRHAGDVAVVLPRLVGAAQDAVVQHVPVHAGVALAQGPQGVGGQVVRPHVLECAGVASDGSADVIADVGFGHGGRSQCFAGEARAAGGRKEGGPASCGA